MLREGSEGGIVGGHIVTEFPNPIDKATVAVINNIEISKIGNRYLSLRFRERSRTHQPAEHLKSLSYQ